LIIAALSKKKRQRAGFLLSYTVRVPMNYHYTLFVICIATVNLSAQPDNGGIVHTGQATYYNATGAGNCMFDSTPNNLMVCAMNNSEYDNASVCGASIHIKGPKGYVTVRIVDRCPECPVGNVDLSKQAFAKIADTIQGRVAITWSYVETTASGPIRYRIKTGSNPWWIGVQVLDHINPIVKFEAMKNGVWTAVPRMDYNYFVDAAGLGPGPFSFRVTDLYGQQLIDMNIPLKPDSVMSGLANFTSHAAVERFPAGFGSVRLGPARPLLIAAAGDCWMPSAPGFAVGVKQVYNSRGQFVGFVSPGAAARLPGRGIFIVK
jgi:expansin